MSGQIQSALSTALEHASHAWRALERTGQAENDPDGPWPPRTTRPVGSAAYHLAAMIAVIKRLHDEVGIYAKEGDHPA